MQNTILCPYCRTPIFFDLNLLLHGETFECSKCHFRISLTDRSSHIIDEANARLEELKKQAAASQQGVKEENL